VVTREDVAHMTGLHWWSSQNSSHLPIPGLL